MRNVLILIGLLISLLSANVSCNSACRCPNRVNPYGVASAFKLNSKVILICTDYGTLAQHPIFESSDLKSIHVRRCVGATLDPRIPGAFKNLVHYDIQGLGLESLSPDDLRFEKLASLHASHNKFTTIPLGLFVHAPNLHTIDLGENKIATVPVGAFSELPNLGWLRLEGNPIRYFDGRALMPLRIKIQTIDFRLPWETIDVFDISHMRGMFNYHIGDRWFEVSQPGVQYVNSFRNDDFGHVKVFNASDTPINSVANLFEFLSPSLEALDVSSSPISHLNRSVFERFEKLHFVNFSNTNLSSFDFDDIHNLKQLDVLDLSHNNLTEIHFPSGVGSFPRLKTLNLIGNQLTEIDFVTLTNFPKLTSLGISQNHLTCKYLDEFLDRWGDVQLDLFEKDANVDGINCGNK